ncbi:hypothetical protein OAS39_13080, partial [Pirellulales bacterium]|nr:hypothetical protein [Pirellulales bacterium]
MSRYRFRLSRLLATSFAAHTLFAGVISIAIAEEHGALPVRAPFEKLDTFCVNDWWNRRPSPIMDLRPPREEVIAFALYTVSNNTLKLSAQFYPLYPEESRSASLEIRRDGTWTKVADAEIHDLGWSAHFRIESWDDTADAAYRVVYEGATPYEGLVRKNPREKNEIVLAALSCNSNKDRGPRTNYVRNINAQDPDLIFFAGDQSYDHSQHTAAWLRFGWQFRETFRNRPCITIPDDHDIGQGNVWGEGGKKAMSKDGSDGGYFFHHEYVKMVERCQTSHLPDPYDPTTIEQGIGVYYT